jgi:riboflavin transporter FmnP
MDAKSIALITIFAALAIVLNAVRIPTFYWGNYVYTLSEIPVLAAFLIYGLKIGLLVEVIHIAGQEMFFPVGVGGIVVYPMGLIVMPLMVFGIYLAKKLINRKSASENQISEKRKAIYYAGIVAAVRGGLMPFADYFILYNFLLPLVLDRVFPSAYLAGLVPAFIIYNVTCALYAVPIAYFVARQASKHLRIEPRLL